MGGTEDQRGRDVRVSGSGGSTKKVGLDLVASKAYGNRVLLVRYDVKYRGAESTVTS
jgi:hypothetical protein